LCRIGLREPTGTVIAILGFGEATANLTVVQLLPTSANSAAES
jgi:hypothetical protein